MPLPPLEPAQPGEAAALHRLREQLEDWLAARGVRQWGHGHAPLAEFARQIRDRQWYVLRDPVLGIAAAVRLLRTDPEVWGEDGTPAVYAHGLMVDRAAGGRGVGAAVLGRVAERAHAHGATVLRLDCVESNAVLRAFYRGQGFREVGRRDFDGPWFSAVLLEKDLRPP